MIPKKRAHLSVTALTHEGMSGKNNEDRYSVSAHTVSEEDPTPSLFALVADGIGGHQAGEIAAEITVDTISHIVANSQAEDPLSILEEAIVQAGQAVHQQAKKDSAQKGMGSTCVCTWILDHRLYIASVGDSRIYLLREGYFQQLTTDHTWVQEALEHGIITPDQARGHPQANIIRRYLGSKEASAPDFRLRLHENETDEQAAANQGTQLHPGDILLLCSDGLTDMVEDAEIQSILGENPLEEALQKLIDAANANGGHDNITAVTVEVPQEPTEPEPKKRGRSKFLWVFGILLGMLVILALVAVAYYAWGLGLPDSTPTPLGETLIPAQMETDSTLVETLAATLPPSPNPSTTPIQATYTPWPTNTLEP